MKFDEVREKHIELAIKDYESYGIPDGFKQSAYFDVKIKGKYYPPKPIMAYANFHAKGVEPINNFSGGVNTPCFNAFERLGIPVIKKTKNMSSNEDLYKLKEDFLAYWPIERLELMTLEEYTDTNRENSFCYWLEHITRDLGSIVGGSSYKFGIYKRTSQSEVKEESNRTTDGEYAWFKKYGEESKEVAFKTVKTIIIKIAKAAQNNTLSVIDDIDLGNAYKWKIAFLYGDYNCLNMFKLDALRIIASNLKIEYNKKTQISYFHQAILKRKTDEEAYFTYCHALWQQYQDRLIDVKKDFAKWLNKNTFESYRSFLGSTTNSIEEKLDEINSFFDEIDFFLVDPKKVNGLVSTILFLMSKKERIKNPEFVAYDSKNSNGIPKAILGKNNYIKFLKETFEYKAPNYWVFQGNPKIYDFETALRDELLTKWTVSSHKDKIKVGDKVIIWITGSKSGCYALAEVTSEPYPRNLDITSDLWSEEDKSNLKADLKITHNFVDTPVLKITLENKEGLRDFNGGNQGTNFKATEEEFMIFLDWHESKLSTMDSKNISTKKIVNPLNQILYGPPGTGKTYNTVNSALQIVDPEFYEKNKLDRTQLKERFDAFVKKGNIVFTTFHQSMSYEDFIEGIKPVMSNKSTNNDLEYEIQDGVLKELVGNMVDFTTSSKKSQIDVIIDKDKFKKNINKVSLGNSNDPEDDEIYQYCIQNNCIALGFGEDIDFGGVKNRNDIRDRYRENGIDFSTSMDFNISSIERLAIWMEEGQLVFISNGNKKLRAIGVVSGNYYCDPSTPIRYSQFRKVNWLYTDIEIPIKQIYGSYFSQQTIYQMAGSKFDYSYFTKSKQEETNSKNYVLIIDEINRGNVSSIFGELITLLETDKRKGNKEELEVILPYSKELFSIPNNLHIIGTMNTADRSVEALDTALRRRFEFKEMMPDYSVIKDEIVGEIKLSKVLETINQRIELLIDRDHTIGHSYFVGVDTKEKLASAFRNKIVPLLQEYFYGDYGKIGLVLGKGFIKKEKNKHLQFSSFNYEGKEEFITPTFTLKPIDKSTIIEAVSQLSETKES